MADGPSSYGTAGSAGVTTSSRVQGGGSMGDKSSTTMSPTSSSSSVGIADIAPALREQAGKVADRSLTTGADAAQAVGKAAESAAQVLDDALPMLAGYVRNAAQYTDRFADSLRDKKAEELLSTAMTWSRQQPLLTLAGAAVLGFALSRIAKAAIPAATTVAHSAAEAAGSVVNSATSAVSSAIKEQGNTNDLPGGQKTSYADVNNVSSSTMPKPAQPMSALGGGNAS